MRRAAQVFKLLLFDEFFVLYERFFLMSSKSGEEEKAYKGI